MAQVSIRMDDETKKEAEALFDELGVSMSMAFNMFVRQSLRERGLPFKPSTKTPNAATLAAMEEVEEMLKSGSGKSYDSMEDLLTELNA